MWQTAISTFVSEFAGKAIKTFGSNQGSSLGHVILFRPNFSHLCSKTATPLPVIDVSPVVNYISFMCLVQKIYIINNLNSHVVFYLSFTRSLNVADFF